MTVRRSAPCVRLAKALRVTLEARGLNKVQLAERINAAPGQVVTSRSQVSQWCNAHRSINEYQLWAFARALDVKIEGPRRRHCAHHPLGVMAADLGAGPVVVTCRSTGNVLFPDAAAVR